MAIHTPTSKAKAAKDKKEAKRKAAFGPIKTKGLKRGSKSKR